MTAVLNADQLKAAVQSLAAEDRVRVTFKSTSMTGVYTWTGKVITPGVPTKIDFGQGRIINIPNADPAIQVMQIEKLTPDTESASWSRHLELTVSRGRIQANDPTTWETHLQNGDQALLLEVLYTHYEAHEHLTEAEKAKTHFYDKIELLMIIEILIVKGAERARAKKDAFEAHEMMILHRAIFRLESFKAAKAGLSLAKFMASREQATLPSTLARAWKAAGGKGGESENSK